MRNVEAAYTTHVRHVCTRRQHGNNLSQQPRGQPRLLVEIGLQRSNLLRSLPRRAMERMPLQRVSGWHSLSVTADRASSHRRQPTRMQPSARG